MKIHLYNLPLVDQYVNQLIASYISIQTQFSQGDILLADKINKLQQKSHYMIVNIDEFMNKNALDPRVRYLYSTRNKLSKFLFKINQNQLVKNVNQIKQNESVFETSPNKKNKHQIISNDKQNGKQVSSRIMNQNQNQKVMFGNINESIMSNEQQSKKYSQQHSNPEKKHYQNQQFSQVKPYKIQQLTPAEKQYKETLKSNSSFLGHNRTLSTRMKPYQQQYEKQRKFQPSYYDQRQKSRTPIKTSRKVQSFTPRNTSNIPSARVQQHNNEANHLNKQNTTRQHGTERKKPTNSHYNHKQYQQQLRSDNKKSTSTIITPRTKLNNDHQLQRTPPKEIISSSNKKLAKNELVNNQSFIYNRQRKNQKYEQQQLVTPRQQVNSGRPSSAMKSLANLIFTIKMTKQEYKEFKKIKEQHQGQNSYINQQAI